VLATDCRLLISPDRLLAAALADVATFDSELRLAAAEVDCLE
jgi:hypothetical protein